MEGDEGGSLAVPIADAHGQRDLSSAARDLDEIALGDPEFLGIRGVDAHEGFGFDLIQGLGAPGHGPGMPVFQQPARIEHEGVFVIGQFPGLAPFSGDEFRPAALGGKALAEEHHRPIIRGGVGVGPEFPGLAEVVVAEGRIRAGESGEFAEDLFG